MIDAIDDARVDAYRHTLTYPRLIEHLPPNTRTLH
jgi:hypothetical protein